MVDRRGDGSRCPTAPWPDTFWHCAAQHGFITHSHPAAEHAKLTLCAAATWASTRNKYGSTRRQVITPGVHHLGRGRPHR
ncbi:MAG: hypothetical protein ACLTMP_04235 [Eggerthella lenta]